MVKGKDHWSRHSWIWKKLSALLPAASGSYHHTGRRDSVPLTPFSRLPLEAMEGDYFFYRLNHLVSQRRPHFIFPIAFRISPRRATASGDGNNPYSLRTFTAGPRAWVLAHDPNRTSPGNTAAYILAVIRTKKTKGKLGVRERKTGRVI